MSRCLDFNQIWYGCSLGIFDDLINFWDESIKNKISKQNIICPCLTFVTFILNFTFCLLLYKFYSEVYINIHTGLAVYQ